MNYRKMVPVLAKAGYRVIVPDFIGSEVLFVRSQPKFDLSYVQDLVSQTSTPTPTTTHTSSTAWS